MIAALLATAVAAAPGPVALLDAPHADDVALAGLRGALAVCGAVAAAWMAVVIYERPGTLVNRGAYEASVAWGAVLALAGSLAVLVVAIGSGSR